MNDFGSVVGQFGSFFRSDRREESGGGNFARIGSEDSVNFFPHLKLGCMSTDRAESGAEIRITSTNLSEK